MGRKEATESKADFARRLGVTRGRITQMIREGLIGPEALDGSGPSARIRISIAKAQIAARRHPGQAAGNGAETNLGAAPKESDGSGLQGALQAQRLEEITRRNRMAAVDEALKLGHLVPADVARQEIGRALQRVEDANAGMLADYASALAAEFAINRRDALHLLQKIRQAKRAEVAATLKAEAEALPETVFVELGATPPSKRTERLH